MGLRGPQDAASLRKIGKADRIVRPQIHEVGTANLFEAIRDAACCHNAEKSTAPNRYLVQFVHRGALSVSIC